MLEEGLWREVKDGCTIVSTAVQSIDGAGLAHCRSTSSNKTLTVSFTALHASGLEGQTCCRCARERGFHRASRVLVLLASARVSGMSECYGMAICSTRWLPLAPGCVVLRGGGEGGGAEALTDPSAPSLPRHPESDPCRRCSVRLPHSWGWGCWFQALPGNQGRAHPSASRVPSKRNPALKIEVRLAMLMFVGGLSPRRQKRRPLTASAR